MDHRGDASLTKRSDADGENPSGSEPEDIFQWFSDKPIGAW